MQGRIIWEYVLPPNLRQYNNPGFDVELLPNDNVLFVLPRHGVYEIDRTGKVVWSYLDDKVSHDADRLPNGNTLVVFGNNDGYHDQQVKEIGPDGRLVWSWRAKDHFWREPFKGIFEQGWTHTNAAERLHNGHTLISLRNFNFIAEVDKDGQVLRTIGEGILWHQHDPVMLPNGNVLTANHTRERAVEIDPATNRVVWRFVPHSGEWRVRDADRLPNGNTLITDATKIAEVSPEGEIVWFLKVEGVTYHKTDWPGRGFYKAQRIAPH
jgi:outer membrane protein assembly factor BamB